MQKVALHAIKVGPGMTSGNRVEIVVSGVTEYRVYFTSKEGVLQCKPEVFASIGLTPAMRLNSVLDVSEELSSQLYSRLDTIQDIYTAWYPNLKKIEVRGAIPVELRHNPSRRVGAFFSGGIDSFYTLLKHSDEITDLIFIRNFDRQVEDRDLSRRKSDGIHQIAAEYGKEVIEVETNLRAFLESYVPWNMVGHGIVLFTVAHLLSGEFLKIYVPASRTYSNLSPLAIHPILDPLWGTESLEIVHDGCEAGRMEKTRLVATSEVALRRLRVCFMNPNGAYNCGRCEKCIRTMIHLELAGALERCSVFDSPLSMKAVRKISAGSVVKQNFIADSLRALEVQNRAPELQNALRYALRRYQPGTIPFLYDKARDSIRRIRRILKQL